MPADQSTNSRIHAKVEFPDETKAERPFQSGFLSVFSVPGPEEGMSEILKIV